MSIGKNIRTIRINHKMTQNELAQKLHVKQTAVSYWENDKREPDFETIKQICNIFSITYNELLDGNWGKYIDDVKEDFSNDNTVQTSEYNAMYYEDKETARLAQEMFEDKQMRSLFHMKKNMDPKKFQAHIDMMEKMYRLEHPEEFPEDY